MSLQDDSDWGMGFQQDKKQEPKRAQTRSYQQKSVQESGGRGGRGNNNSQIQWQENKKQDKLDDSDWMNEGQKEKSRRESKQENQGRRGGRGNNYNTNNYQQKKKQESFAFNGGSQQKDTRSTRGRPSAQNIRGNCGQQQKKVQKKDFNNKQEKILGDDLQMSNWFDQIPVQPNQNIGKKARGAQISNMSFHFNSMDKELEPDDKIITSFVAENKSGGRGNRNQSQKQSEQSASRRGNRDSKGYNQKNQDRGTQRRYNNYSRNNDGGPRGGYNGGYQNGNNYRNNEGYRGNPRGRGGYRGGFQGRERDGREGQYEENQRYQPRQQNLNFKKKDNQYISQASDEPAKQPQSNQQDGRSKRGNRGNRGQTNPEGSNYNRGYNRQYNNRDNNNRDYNNNNRDRNYNRQYKPKDSNYNNNRDYNNGNRQEDAQSSQNYSSSYSGRNQKPNNEVQQKKQTYNSANSIPKGRRCWPQSSIYILGCKMAITYRSISDFSCKLLVIPYSSMKMDYYPGNIINSSNIDYKKRIIQKGDEIAGAGGVYLQKSIDVGKFVGLAFLKIDEKRIKDSLKLGIKQLLSKVESMQGTVLDSILFPICKKMQKFDVLIDSFLENLEECKKIKEVYITTNEPQCLQMAMNAFTQKVKELLDDNKILFT